MQQVPCGRCVECMKLRVNSWYVRINEELKVSSSAYFVTLTYEHEPCTPEGEPTLDYRDIQLFMKRLRKCQIEKIRYFIVGEYGSKTGRPHYHALLFNIKNIDDVQKCWTLGFTHIGKVQDESIFYTLKYSLKRAVKWKKRQEYDPLPEKALVSHKLGLSFLTQKMIDYYKADPSRSVTMLNNIKFVTLLLENMAQKQDVLIIMHYCLILKILMMLPNVGPSDIFTLGKFKMKAYSIH